MQKSSGEMPNLKHVQDMIDELKSNNEFVNEAKEREAKRYDLHELANLCRRAHNRLDVPRVLELLNGQQKNLSGMDMRALVMTPTRELAAQVLETAATLSRLYHWVVCGGVVGGENKQKEKARLRKGVCLLVATPGRLLDHLRHTEAMKADLLRWLVLDEADRLLDLGFEEDLNAILADLNRRTSGAARCTALLSATLTAGTSRLIDLAMTDPATIEIDPEEPEVVDEGWTGNGHGHGNGNGHACDSGRRLAEPGGQRVKSRVSPRLFP